VASRLRKYNLDTVLAKESSAQMTPSGTPKLAKMGDELTGAGKSLLNPDHPDCRSGSVSSNAAT
jgi:hypothetical protein